MRKKVLIIGPSYLPIPSTEGGAIEGLIDEYLKYNSEKRKYDVTVYSTFSNSINIDNNLKYNNTTFRYINKNNILYYVFRIICLILKFFRKNKQNPYPYALNVIHDIRKRKENNTYDIIIIENQIESIITYRKFLKGKLISHLHNDYLNSDTIQAKKILDSCDEVWGVSNFICKQICTIDSEAVKKVNTLYNGIDLRKFDTKDISSKEKNQMYKRIGVSSNNFIVLYVGRIMPEKGVLELAKAFNLAKEKNDNMKLIIVGAKKGRSNDLDEYYKKIEDEQQKSNNSIVFYGKADSKELRVLYSIANVQVVPSLWNEAFGLIVVEGMCGNTPLIVSNSGGIPEIIGNNAIIVERNNIINEIKNGIIDIKNNQKKYKKSIQNYDRILKKFDINIYNLNFEKYIAKSLKK